MANHIRQQIREYFGTNLTGLSTTGANVYESRVYPIENSKLPALIIYTKSETSEPIVIGTDRVMSRELSVVVEGYAKAASDFDDTIDTISKEVEQAIEKYNENYCNLFDQPSFLTLNPFCGFSIALSPLKYLYII